MGMGSSAWNRAFTKDNRDNNKGGDGG